VIQCASVPWVHGLGFVTNMPELMSSVDVVGIKAGAATTYEAIALKKPILFIDYVAENERANIYAVLKDNRGWQVNSLSQVSTFLQRIYNNPGELATVQKNAQDFNYLNGGPHIAEYIVKLLD
jgi:UDP-N-acetylglucosamine:LPS N-acetylglucosamine transferase